MFYHFEIIGLFVKESYCLIIINNNYIWLYINNCMIPYVLQQNKYSFFMPERHLSEQTPLNLLCSSYSRFELVTSRTFILNPEARQPTNNAVCFRSPIAELLR